MSQFISLTPGQTYSGVVKISNPSGSSADVAFAASVSPYNVTDQYYTADLATRSNFSQIVDWVDLPSPTGTIAPNSTAEIPFTITVPADAPAGGQYATIVISQSPGSAVADGGVSNVVSMASIIYADVAGETTHSGQILENTIPGFSLTIPIAASALIENTGNVHETATIELSVVNTLTGAKIFPQNNDSSDISGTFTEVIMPSSTRLIMRQIDDLPALGIVNITQTVQYNGETSTISQNVIICPIWFIALATLTIIAIVIALIARIRHHRHT